MRKSKDYAALVEETISLMGKIVEMPGTTLGGFVPQTIGVGEMKLDAPPQYASKRQPGI